MTSLGATYFPLASMLNKRIIKITLDHIYSTYTPIPVIKNVTINTSNIQQLYVTRLIDNSISEGGYVRSTVTYNLIVLTSEKKEIKIVWGEHVLDDLKYIERNVEKYLNIKVNDNLEVNRRR